MRNLSVREPTIAEIERELQEIRKTLGNPAFALLRLRTKAERQWRQAK